VESMMFENCILKTCSKCLKQKNTSEFNKKRNALQSWCKLCENERTKIWYQNNKEKRNKKAREWEAANRDKVNTAKKARRQKQKDLLPEKPKKEPFDKKKWISENKHRFSGYRKNWLNKSPTANVAERIRRRINESLKRFGYIKRNKSSEILGCDWQLFKNHIEKQFKPGMTWDNRAKWHLDHIVPIASAKTEDDVIKLNHYTNLRPLWAHENLIKSAKMEFLL